MPARRRQSSPHFPGTGPGRPGGGRSGPSAAGDNSLRQQQLGDRDTASGAVDLDSVFDLVLAGDFDGAKAGARAAAQSAREAGQADLSWQAGLVWQVADGFDKAEDAVEDKRFAEARTHASAAADRSRDLLPTGAVDTADLDKAIQSAGKVWELADKAARSSSGKGRDTPMIDQHQLDHARNWAFCGVATLVMMLRANGIDQGTSRGDLNQLAGRVYHKGSGTSGASMAGVLRERGLEDSTYTTTGTVSHLVASLDKGQPVPFGVMSVRGTVTKLEGGQSERYGSRRVGDAHHREFKGSGHWVIVTRYEGKAEKPSAYFVNDPDLGGELRCTPAQLDQMGMGSGSYWMVHQ